MNNLTRFAFAAWWTTCWMSPLVESAASAADRPNILWITAEDHGTHLGCYGDPDARTPRLDALAAKGLKYAKCWSVHPVCAPARTCLITGMYPASLGAEQMRSLVDTPHPLYPRYLRDAGYYCTNNVKEDYNVRSSKTLWDDSSNKAHWKNRPAQTPFFAVFNFTGTHESGVWDKSKGLSHDPAKVRIPSYHPDLPAVRADWAKYHDNITASDTRAGDLIDEVAASGLSDDTVIFYYSDHGAGMPRSKRSACNSGLHVPLIIHIPEKWKHLAPSDYSPGGTSNRLVSFVDLAPTALSLAGVKPPPHMQGLPFAGTHTSLQGHEFLFGGRGRMDSHSDLVRSATDGRFVYVRNYATHRPHGQPLHYAMKNDTARAWRALAEGDSPTPAQRRHWQVPREPEELYDLSTDPDEVRNLADNPSHAANLNRLRDALTSQMTAIRDLTLIPEAELRTRSASMAPIEWAKSDRTHPFAEVLATANLATRSTDRQSDDVAALARLLDQPNPIVRYWAANGLLMRQGGGDTALRALAERLNDDSASVRIVTCEALCRYGPPELKPQAGGALLDVLKNHHDNCWVLLEAFNAALHCDAALRSVEGAAEVIRKVPAKNAAWEPRSSNHVADLRDDLLQKLGER